MLMWLRAAAHEGDDNTPSGPTGRGVKDINVHVRGSQYFWCVLYNVRIVSDYFIKT